MSQFWQIILAIWVGALVLVLYLGAFFVPWPRFSRRSRSRKERLALIFYYCDPPQHPRYFPNGRRTDWERAARHKTAFYTGTSGVGQPPA